MLALSIGAVLSVILRALFVIGMVLGSAYALTTYVKLPGFVDTLIWIGAGGYALLWGISLFMLLAALVVAGSNPNRFR